MHAATRVRGVIKSVFAVVIHHCFRLAGAVGVIFPVCRAYQFYIAFYNPYGKNLVVTRLPRTGAHRALKIHAFVRACPHSHRAFGKGNFVFQFLSPKRVVRRKRISVGGVSARKFPGRSVRPRIGKNSPFGKFRYLVGVKRPVIGGIGKIIGVEFFKQSLKALIVHDYAAVIHKQFHAALRHLFSQLGGDVIPIGDEHHAVLHAVFFHEFHNGRNHIRLPLTFQLHIML